MKIKLEINNTTNSPIENGFFERVAKETLEESSYAVSDERTVVISVALVSGEEIRKLNKDYRRNDAVTDILSFAEFESHSEVRDLLAMDLEEELFLGELILCYNDIKEYAAKENLGLEMELAKVFSHGFLHLLGFVHGNKMFDIQQRVADLLIKQKNT